MANDPWTRAGSKRIRIRERLSRIVATGEAVCPFCGTLILPGQSWDVDHALSVVHDPEGEYLLDMSNVRPAHSRCNRRHGQRLATARKKLRRPARPAVPPRLCPGCDGPLPPEAERLCLSCEEVCKA